MFYQAISVLRTKLSKNDCHGTWFQSWQCYQRPPAQQWFNGWTSVHPCLCTLEGRENHLSLTELPRQHAMLTQDVLRTKLSRNDCYGTWSPSRQCYQGPQTERKLKGVHLCAPLSGPKQFCKSTMEAVKNALKSNRFWCVNSDCEILQILHFSPGPKVLSANVVCFRLAQKYLVQIQHFFDWPKTVLQ